MVCSPKAMLPVYFQEAWEEGVLWFPSALSCQYGSPGCYALQGSSLTPASCSAAILSPFRVAISTILFIEVLLNRIVQSGC